VAANRRIFALPSFLDTKIMGMPRVYLFICLSVLVLLSIEAVRASIETHVIDPNRGRTAVFALYAGDTVVKNDGQYALCSANGVVWHDLDGDGMINEDHNVHGLGGITVHLYWANGSIAESTTTKKDGSYTFKVEPGTAIL
jgi:hypothetical protein